MYTPPPPMIFTLDDLRFWLRETIGTFGRFGLMIPAREPASSWDPAEDGMFNKFICESVALLRTDDE